MKTKIRYVLFALFILFVFSCAKEENPVKPDPTTGYEQYGVPFQGVPETEDIVMYEVNFRALSPDRNLKGLIARLDEIKKLGVNVIWLMPVHPIGQVKSVNSPYSVKDYKAVSSEYGTLGDLRQLTDQAHAKGIAVIMDWVANHTAWDNAWISNKTWYTQDASGNIIHPPGTNWQDVADLNYANIKMREAMTDAMKYWALEANIDGFRCDYADGVPYDFWKQAIDSLHVIPNRKFIFFAEGTRADHFNAGFDLNFGWQSYSAVKDVFNGQSAAKIITAHQNEYSNTPAGKHWVRFTTNHDESAWDATPVSLFNGINGALAASVAIIFPGGVPLIYSSQEVGTAQNVPFFSTSVTQWNANPDMLETYQKMLQFYASSEAARKGNNTVYSHADILCFKKSYAGKEIVILVNVRNKIVQYNLPPALRNTSWTDIITGETMTLGDQIQCKAYSFYILNGQS